MGTSGRDGRSETTREVTTQEAERKRDEARVEQAAQAPDEGLRRLEAGRLVG
jgi:hypothetical protein